MARPVSNLAKTSLKLRGNVLYVQWFYQRLQVRLSTDVRVEPQHVGRDGFVKTSHDEHVTLNRRLQACFTRIQTAATNVYRRDKCFTTETMKMEYERLVEVEEDERVRKAEIKLYTYMQIASSAENERRANPNPVPGWDLTIEQLEELLREKKRLRDHEARLSGDYDQELLTTFLHTYKTRRGNATMEDATGRVLDSLIKIIRRFHADWKIQDVNEQTLIRFQDWLIAEGKLNSTIETYTTKIKSCLNYYVERPELVPAHVKISRDYKKYSCNLTQKTENIISLTQAELWELLSFEKYQIKSWEKIRDVFVLLCATGCRISDIKTIEPTLVKEEHIHLTPRKTKKKRIQVIIPLNPISTYILQKYEFDMTSLKLEDYYLNEQIKIICKIIGGTFLHKEKVENYSGKTFLSETKERWEVISSHCGRRTYCTLRAAQGASVAELMVETGHTEPKTLMGYVNKKMKRIKEPFTLPNTLAECSPAQRL